MLLIKKLGSKRSEFFYIYKPRKINLLFSHAEFVEYIVYYVCGDFSAVKFGNGGSSAFEFCSGDVVTER